MSRTACDAAAAFADVVYADQQWVDAEFTEIVAASFGGPPAPPPPAPPRVPPVPGTPPPPHSRRPAPGPAVPLFPVPGRPAAGSAHPRRAPGRPARSPRPAAEQPGTRQQPYPGNGRRTGRPRQGTAGHSARRAAGLPRAGSPAAVCLPWHPPGPRGGQPTSRPGWHTQQHRKEVLPDHRRPGQVMQAKYYDRDGPPVSEQRWQELGRQLGYSRIGYTDEIRHGLQVTVVTFRSGIAGPGPDGPLLFCTCAGIRAPDGRNPPAGIGIARHHSRPRRTPGQRQAVTLDCKQQASGRAHRGLRLRDGRKDQPVFASRGLGPPGSSARPGPAATARRHQATGLLPPRIARECGHLHLSTSRCLQNT